MRRAVGKASFLLGTRVSGHLQAVAARRESSQKGEGTRRRVTQPDAASGPGGCGAGCGWQKPLAGGRGGGLLQGEPTWLPLAGLLREPLVFGEAPRSTLGGIPGRARHLGTLAPLCVGGQAGHTGWERREVFQEWEVSFSSPCSDKINTSTVSVEGTPSSA